MAWLRNGTSQPDTGFTVGDVNYPAGWIKNNPQSEREKLNITLAPQPAPHDQRFSWGWNSDGTEKWKELADLKKLWVDIQTNHANRALARSDWLVVRKTEAGTAIPTAWADYRTAVRLACNNRQTEFDAASTSEALKALVTSPSTVSQNKKDGSGNDIEIKDESGNSYDPKRYEVEDIPNTGNVEVKYPWPDEPTS